MSLKTRVFAAAYDRVNAASEEAGLRDQRRELLAQVRGRVLEIGGGTGANLPLYGDAVTALVVTEPDPHMMSRLECRVSARGSPVEVVRASAEHLPFEDGSFDCVVSTLVLCGVQDQPRALAEVRRVLKPDGRFLFLEHVRAEDEGLARWQDRLNWLNQFVVNCDCNRRTLSGIRAAGFEVEDVSHGELQKVPPFVRPMILGSAVPGTAAGGGA